MLIVMKKQLQRQCKPSRVGWLYDEVTNPFILCITKDFTNTFYCASQKPYFITYRKSFGRLSKIISWSTFKKNLIPFNLSNLHWMLIYINMKKSVHMHWSTKWVQWIIWRSCHGPWPCVKDFHQIQKSDTTAYESN